MWFEVDLLLFFIECQSHDRKTQEKYVESWRAEGSAPYMARQSLSAKIWPDQDHQEGAIGSAIVENDLSWSHRSAHIMNKKITHLIGSNRALRCLYLIRL